MLRTAALMLSPLFLAGAVPAGQLSGRTWTFEQLLRTPSPEETKRVDEAWRQKKWAVGDVALAGTARVPVGAVGFEARLFTYALNGSPRCGAVLTPPGAGRRSLAGLVDVGDIRWDYPDRDLTRGPYVAKILAEQAREFALMVPCARGTGLRIGPAAVRAGGDRRDAWEGVAEDAIAFLTAALSVTPQIDPRRLAVYGYSRGGGVALIVGQRDPRIKAVLSFAGPTDWFTAMGRPNVDWAARLEEASRDPRLPADSRESQYLDWFVRGRESLPLTDLRDRLIASSPLYFVEKLPAFQIHQGADDGPVPVRNALMLRGRLDPADPRGKVFIYEGAGHALDNTAALSTARAFLLEWLAVKSSE